MLSVFCKCHYAGHRIFIVMLSVVVLGVAFFVFMLSFIIVNVAVLSVIMLSVMALLRGIFYR